MGVVKMVKSAIGLGDQVAELTAEVERLRGQGLAAFSAIEKLEEAKQAAEDFATVEAIGRQIAEKRWFIEKTARRFEAAEARLAAANVDRTIERIGVHQKTQAAIYGRLRTALLQASAVQAEAIAAMDSARAELGEGIALQHLAHIAYLGFMLPDLVLAWAKDMDRGVAALAPAESSRARLTPRRPADPAVAAAAREQLRSGKIPTMGDKAGVARPAFASGKTPEDMAAEQSRQARHGSRRAGAGSSQRMVTSNDVTPYVPPEPRAPDDLAPLGADELRCQVRREGYQHPQGHQCGVNQIIRLPASIAQAAAKNGAIDIIEAPPAAKSQESLNV